MVSTRAEEGINNRNDPLQTLESAMKNLRQLLIVCLKRVNDAMNLFLREKQRIGIYKK
jgi:hypothetical protein